MQNPVLLTVKEGIAHLVLNDPARRNAMSPSMAEAFYDTVEKLKHMNDVKAVVLTGAGSAFCAGGDLAFLEERTRQTPEENHHAMRWFYSRFLSLRSLPVPVVAAINGHAMGAGLALTLAADWRVGAEEARMGFNFSRLGVSPGMASTFYLPRRTSATIAAGLLCSGETFGAQEAKAWGMVQEVYPAEAVVSAARVAAASLSAGKPPATVLTLRALRQQEDAGLDAVLDTEAWHQAACYASPAFQKTLRGLVQKIATPKAAVKKKKK